MAEPAKRIVVKTGSRVLCNDAGALDIPVLQGLVAQMAALRDRGWEVLLVSSGAVAAGGARPGTQRLQRADPVTRRQVLAAAGQVYLMQTYQDLFGQHGVTVAQVLASKSDFQTRNHYLNMRNCIQGILAAGIVPIVNENDVVAITELMFTDNDELAGLLAGMVNADLLCLLSTVSGVYASGQDETVIARWDEQRHRIDDVVNSGTSKLGRGGMHSKLAVARKTAALGTEVCIAHGQSANVLIDLAEGKPLGTRFAPGAAASPAKRWLASADDHAAGAVRINRGAVEALRDRNRLTSLLPVGVEAFEGEFKRGDVIRILGPDGAVLGCGRAQYDRGEAERCIGQRDRKPVIHYDYLYLVD
ncbi:MAG: glutamate 5-kinase [Xanthomonadales bacterium]|nr:glutamate 5-kinase [Xanthomonadales bacterium]NIN59533.1 glutamate 5-kinase [Xanthomonadales bacterium]NIN74899.1 glutamate 5-kinase [Xanthomonadales bacterium]NIO14041.1 glutamate 5-kinase [Xanthomonadales bacterium]NIP11926.1 glutamate 5-kinase [Xanthomonadales bacterium]